MAVSPQLVRVVVCFHLSIFEPLETVGSGAPQTKQGCGLLSFKYLWTIGNSIFFIIQEHIAVVVCFHLSIFEPLETVYLAKLNYYPMLWSAFI